MFDDTETTATAVSGSVTAGATVYIRTTVEAGQTVSYEILSSSTATGSFVSRSATAEGQSLLCKQGSAGCDTPETDSDGNAADVNSTVTAALRVAATSRTGLLVVKQTVLEANTATIDVIEVAGVTTPSQIKISANRTSISSTEVAAAGVIPSGANVVTLTIEVLNSKREGLPNQTVTVQTTNGLLNNIESTDGVLNDAGDAFVVAPVAAGSAAPNADKCSDSLGCRVTTRATAAAVGTAGTLAVTDRPAVDVGTAQLMLSGGGRSGVATVTVSQGNLRDSVEIVLHAGAKNISVDSDESSIQSGGSTFLVATVTDVNDQPVAGATVSVAGAPNAPSGPEDDSVPVSYDDTVTRPNPPSPVPIPACSTGTDAKGKCAVKVYAVRTDVDPDGAAGSLSAAKATTDRGTHTVTLTTAIAGGMAKDSASFEVSGAPAAIATDAPARVDALSSTKITVTVTDDAGELAGAAAIRVDQIEGDGKITDGPTEDGSTMTRDGQRSFTYLAPLTPGEAVFLVRIGVAPGPVIDMTVTIAVGPESVEAEPEPDPGPPATWNNELVSGQNLVVWNGEDGADPSAGAAEGVTAIWSYNTGSGSWDGYFPDAADVPGGNTLTSLSNGQAYVVIVE